MNKKRICSTHGLWIKTSTVTRCPKCTAKLGKVYNKFKRNKTSADIYKSNRWKKLRQIQLSLEPFCISCGRPAVIVDHIKEIKDGGDAYDLNNLQSMCISCHNTKTSNQKKERESK